MPASYLSTDPNAGLDEYLSTDPNAGLADAPASPVAAPTDLSDPSNAGAFRRFLGVPKPNVEPVSSAPRVGPDPNDPQAAGPWSTSLTGIGIPRPFPNKGEGVLEQSLNAAQNLPVDIANFALSPAGAATATIGPVLPPLIQRAVALGFTVQQAWDAYNAGTLQDKLEAAGGAALGAFGVFKGPETIARAKTEAIKRSLSSGEATPAQPATVSRKPLETPEPATLSPHEAGLISEGPPTVAEDVSGLPTGKGVTQRFQQPTGPAIPDFRAEAELGLPLESEIRAALGEESTAAPSAANDFRPALRTDEGVIPGEQGQVHEDIYKAQPDPAELRAQEPEHGFVDQSGNFKTREQVSQALGEPEPMQSERLRELQSSEPTSTKNSAVEASREARGLDPIEKEASQSFQQVWDDVGKRVASDPHAPERLANEIAAKPRAVDPVENGLLIRRLIDAKKEHDAAVEGVNSAADDTSRAEAQIRLEQAREDYDIADTAATHAGTKLGQGLNARKMMVNDDYSLAKMEATKRAANGGKKLNPRQLAELKTLSDKMSEIQKKLSKYETKERFDQLVREARKEAKGKTLDRFIDERAEAARTRLRDVICEI